VYVVYLVLIAVDAQSVNLAHSNVHLEQKVVPEGRVMMVTVPGHHAHRRQLRQPNPHHLSRLEKVLHDCLSHSELLPAWSASKRSYFHVQSPHSFKEDQLT
jgi:hypothetical protein